MLSAGSTGSMESLDSLDLASRLASSPAPPTIPDGLLSDDLHDARSSSLSEIDEALDDSQLDLSPRLEKFASEIDSEAETERIDDSPHRFHNRTSIVLSAGAYGASPSKLAQSTTYDNLDDDEANELEVSPSKPSRELRLNGVRNIFADSAQDDTDSPSLPPEVANKKRKRGDSTDNDEGLDDDVPLRKRRSSLTGDDKTLAAAEEDVTVTSALEAEQKINDLLSPDEISPANEDQADDNRASSLRVRKGKKGKRKGKRSTKDYDDLAENGTVDDNQMNGDEPLPEDEDNAEIDGQDELEAAVKIEECRSFPVVCLRAEDKR